MANAEQPLAELVRPRIPVPWVLSTTERDVMERASSRGRCLWIAVLSGPRLPAPPAPPPVWLAALERFTAASLHRGSRPSSSKQNCLKVQPLGSL